LTEAAAYRAPLARSKKLITSSAQLSLRGVVSELDQRRREEALLETDAKSELLNQQYAVQTEKIRVLRNELRQWSSGSRRRMAHGDDLCQNLTHGL